jgi:hypothetical protein
MTTQTTSQSSTLKTLRIPGANSSTTSCIALSTISISSLYNLVQSRAIMLGCTVLSGIWWRRTGLKNDPANPLGGSIHLTLSDCIRLTFQPSGPILFRKRRERFSTTRHLNWAKTLAQDDSAQPWATIAPL